MKAVISKEYWDGVRGEAKATLGSFRALMEHEYRTLTRRGAARSSEGKAQIRAHEETERGLMAELRLAEKKWGAAVAAEQFALCHAAGAADVKVQTLVSEGLFLF